MKPPVPPRHAHTLESPFGEPPRQDPYHHFRTGSAEVRRYLAAENRYADAVLKQGHAPRLFRELKGRVAQEDCTVPRFGGVFWYASRAVAGKEYRVHHRDRSRRTDVSSWGVVMDDNVEAARLGCSFYRSAVDLDDLFDPDLMAVGFDTSGRGDLDLYLRRLGGRGGRDGKGGKGGKGGEGGGDVLVRKAVAAFGWVARGTLWYLTYGAAHAVDKVWRYDVATAEHALLYHEPDESFQPSFALSRSRGIVILESSNAFTTRQWFRSADSPPPTCHGPGTIGAGWVPVETPRPDVTFDATHRLGQLFVWRRDRDGLCNGELVVRDVDGSHRRTLVRHSSTEAIVGCSIGLHHAILTKRIAGLDRVFVCDLQQHGERIVALPRRAWRELDIRGTEPAYAITAGFTGMFDSHTLRYVVSSLVRAPTTVDVHIPSWRARTQRITPVPTVDLARYESGRDWARSHDGARVPISWVRAKGSGGGGEAPSHLLVNVYGGYGVSNDAGFHRDIFSLLDRGFTYAIAHVRGGSDLGHRWTEAGKLLRKRNTFLDTIACVEHLERRLRPTSVTLSGASSGGLTVGAVITMRPELVDAAVMDVPFVDVVTSLMDPSIPLSISDRQELGDPAASRRTFRYQRSYSPYDNLRAGARYPHVLLTTSLDDTRVPFWEPAKFCARLREVQQAQEGHGRAGGVALLRCDMHAGHGGRSGRFARLRDVAAEYAFILLAGGNRGGRGSFGALEPQVDASRVLGPRQQPVHGALE